LLSINAPNGTSKWSWTHVFPINYSYLLLDIRTIKINYGIGDKQNPDCQGEFKTVALGNQLESGSIDFTCNKRYEANTYRRSFANICSYDGEKLIRCVEESGIIYISEY
jgi:hypothetical protein